MHRTVKFKVQGHGYDTRRKLCSIPVREKFMRIFFIIHYKNLTTNESNARSKSCKIDLLDLHICTIDSQNFSVLDFGSFLSSGVGI